MTPPATDRRHGKGARIVIGPDIDKPGVAPDVVNPIGIGARDVGRGKVVGLDCSRLFRGTPLLPPASAVIKRLVAAG